MNDFWSRVIAGVVVVGMVVGFTAFILSCLVRAAW